MSANYSKTVISHCPQEKIFRPTKKKKVICAIQLTNKTDIKI